MDSEKIRYGTLPFAITAAGILLLEYGARFLPFDFLVSTGVTRIVQGGFIILVIFWLSDQVSIPGILPRRVIKGIKRGVAWSFGFGMAAAVSGLVLHMAGTNPLALLRMSLPSNPFSLILFFLVGGVIGPIAEELFFRGVIYGFFRRWGIAPALLISAGLFTMAHGISSAGVIQITGGVLFAAVYEYEKNLVVPVIIHVSGNLSLFSLGLLSGILL